MRKSVIKKLKYVFLNKQQQCYEIEWPRCYDQMVLRSDFDRFFYFRKECCFILFYAIKKQASHIKVNTVVNSATRKINPLTISVLLFLDVRI